MFFSELVQGLHLFGLLLYGLCVLSRVVLGRFFKTEAFIEKGGLFDLNDPITVFVVLRASGFQKSKTT